MKYKVFLLIFFASWYITAYAQPKEVSNLMERFRYKEAIELLQNMPETTENQLLKAECHQKLYNYGDALQLYRLLSENQPDNLSIAIAAAECASQAGDAETSLKYWIKANALQPQNPFLETRKAMAFYRAGDWENTIKSAETVFEKDSIPLLLRMTGDAYLNRNDVITANYFFTKALDKNPSDHISLSRICEFYYALGDIGYDTVIVMTDAYLQTINENQTTIGQLNGMANYSVGKYKEAIERLKKNVELGDSAYTTSYFLGMSYYASKRYFDATKWLEKAYELKRERDINLLYYYGVALTRTYDRQKGIDVLLEGMDKVEKMSKMLVNFDMSIADAYSRSNAPSRAIEYYKSALKRDPTLYPILYNIAHAYDSMKDLENALSYYEQFVKISGKNKKNMEKNKPETPNPENTTVEDFYYEGAQRRIQDIKKELFLKKGRK